VPWYSSTATPGGHPGSSDKPSVQQAPLSAYSNGRSRCVAGCTGALHYVAGCCRVLRAPWRVYSDGRAWCVAVYKCVAMGCRVLQCGLGAWRALKKGCSRFGEARVCDMTHTCDMSHVRGMTHTCDMSDACGMSHTSWPFELCCITYSYVCV